LPDVPEWTPREKLQGEKEMLGFYVTGHPLDHYRDKITDLATHNSANLEGLSKGNEVALCGILTAIQKKRNREQKPWAAMQLEDLQGSVELLVFTTQYERLAPMLVEDRAVLIRGLALPEDGAAPKISVQEVTPLDVARVALPTLISVRVRLGRASDASGELMELFRRKPGETQVRFRLEQARDFSVILDVPAKVRPDREFREAVEKICGAEAIEVLAS
jgi:DNA polymerase-3 subunit alpha